MDLIEIIKLAFRRWYITVPLVMATLIGAALVQQAAIGEFEARGTVLMQTPELDPSRSPRAVIDISNAVRDLRDEESRDRVTAGGGTGDFEVEVADASRVEVVVPGVSDRAQTTARLILDELETRVLDRQATANIPEGERLAPRTSIRFRADDGSLTTEPPPSDALGGDSELTVVTVGILSLEDPTGGQGNPFGPDDSTGRILEGAIESQVGRQRLEARLGPDVVQEYDISPSGDPGIIGLRVVTTSRGSALEAFDVLRDVLADELDARQDRAEVPQIQRLRVEVLAAPIEAEDISGPVDRATAVIVALGGLATLGVLLLLEALVNRRRTAHDVAVGTSAFPSASRDDSRHDGVGSGPSEGQWADGSVGPVSR